MAVFVFIGLAILVVAVAKRPHGMGPALGAFVGVAIASLSGAVEPHDALTALDAQWRAYITLAAVMTMTSAAERMGLFARLAAIIEPRTRGPVKHAFRVTFVLSAFVAATLSNDAAVLVMTPTVLLLLRAVYPKRSPVFVGPFAIAVFVAAGVAPLVISNPMNLIFAEHTGIDFNDYAVVMIPVALAGWLTSYVVLAWLYRDVLADTTPAYGGEWPDQPPPLTLRSKVVLVTVVAALCAYPVMAFVGQPLWPVAAAGGAICALATLIRSRDVGASVTALGKGIAWSIFPFLLGVFVLAIALERVGMVEWLRSLYSGAHPLPVIGVTSTAGSALLNNHPMSVLNAFALEGRPDPHHINAFAALVGGNLGPRILPVGSLAALLWFDMLRRNNVVVRGRTFVGVGIALTIPTLIVSLGVLGLISALR